MDACKYHRSIFCCFPAAVYKKSNLLVNCWLSSLQELNEQKYTFEWIWSFFDSLHDILISEPIKRWHRSNKNIENNSQRPNVTFLAVISSNDFRGNVIRLHHNGKITVPIFLFNFFSFSYFFISYFHT